LRLSPNAKSGFEFLGSLGSASSVARLFLGGRAKKSANHGSRPKFGVAWELERGWSREGIRTMKSRTLQSRTLLKSRAPHLLLRSFFTSEANSSFQTSENEIDDNNKKPKSVKWHGFPSKPVRSLFYVPGSSKRMLEKAWTLNVDNIVMPPFRPRIHF